MTQFQREQAELRQLLEKALSDWQRALREWYWELVCGWPFLRIRFPILPTHKMLPYRGNDWQLYVPESTDRRVVAAAILGEDGQPYSLPAPNRHGHIIHWMVTKLGHRRPIQGVQGFVLDDGTFVGRKTAARLALSNGQCEKLTAPPRLYSEDLW